MHTLSLHKVTKLFMQGEVQLEVLKNITVHFKQAHTYAISGISGAGKSTLLHILAGLDEPTSGEVLFDKRNLFEMSLKKKEHFFNTTIGLIFQNPYLIDELSVIENVMLKGLIAGRSYQKCKTLASQLLQQVGLSDKQYALPRTLSGGQAQRVAIVRALFNEPAFLLADEPTGNLDEETGKTIINLLLEMHQQYNMGLIISSHDRYVTQQMKNKIYLKNGVIEIQHA